MAQTFPFTRANASGWGFGEKLTSAQQNTVDLNAAQAADGLQFSDRSIARDWRKEFTITDRGDSIIWSPGYDGAGAGRWLTFGNAASLIVGSAFVQDADDDEALTLPAVDIAPSLVQSSATNGTGIILVGGFGGTSSSKLIESSDDGNTWATRTTVDVTSASITSIVHDSSNTLFVAGMSNGNIETSPDGQTWTNRTVPNSDDRSSLATDGSSIIVGSTEDSTDKIITSGDGVTWAERTLPSTDTKRRVYWINDLSKFLMLGATTILGSTDGITWSAAGLAVPFVKVTVAATNGRILVASNDLGVDQPGTAIMTTIDGGVSWEISGNSDSITAGQDVAFGDHQWCIARNNGVHLLSFRGGV